MSDYLYGNTRLRASKSALLSPAELTSLTNSPSLDAFYDRLMRTTYRSDVEVALAQFSGLETLSHLLRNHQAQTIKKLRGFYEGKIKEMIERILWRYEIHNIKTILRSQTVQEDPGLVSATLIPTGLVPWSVLSTLINAQDVYQVINRVTSLGLPYAAALRGNGTENLTLLQMETHLEQWYFDFARRTGLTKTPGWTLFSTMLDMEADFINLLLAIRSVSTSQTDHNLVLDQMVPPGKISTRQLKQFMDASTLDEAFAGLPHHPFKLAFQEIEEEYERFANISDLEKQMRLLRLEIYLKWYQNDPLGIGIPLGYMALKQNEQRNLSWIGRCIHFRLPAQTIQDNLEILA
ncbi:MAG: V-type ATPase subunit [Anaerolineae bacterium]|jgi:vacuolar-type H+-ATPase subunit C/Vma6|nr:V-type ATPase subunit [Anaerolineae bacterium]